jgi:hypothetical protein
MMLDLDEHHRADDPTGPQQSIGSFARAADGVASNDLLKPSINPRRQQLTSKADAQNPGIALEKVLPDFLRPAKTFLLGVEPVVFVKQHPEVLKLLTTVGQGDDISGRRIVLDKVQELRLILPIQLFDAAGISEHGLADVVVNDRAVVALDGDVIQELDRVDQTGSLLTVELE